MYAVSINDPAIASIQTRLECNSFVAELVRMEMDRLRERGEQGKRPFDLHARHDRKDFIDVARHPVYSGADEHELGDMFEAAWLDGIQVQDRLTVELDSTSADACCGECEANLSNGMDECDACGSHNITRYVDVTVRGPYASLWADPDPYIDGSTWEEDGPHFIWTRLIARPGLAADLEEEGYVLDQSNYSEEEDEA